MRRVIGKRVIELSSAEFAGISQQYQAVLLDVGTGDGKHALKLARQRPEWLVVGLDSAAERMRESSLRSVANPTRGGVPNVVFVWASVEQFPIELCGISELHVIMPWGSLLRAMVAGDTGTLATLARACVAGAKFLITLNLHAWRPPVPEVGETLEPDPAWVIEELAQSYAGAGWRVEQARYLDEKEIQDLATSWTKRLNSSRNRFDVLALSGTVNPAI